MRRTWPRKLVVLAAALALAAGGSIGLTKHLGARRLAAAVERFEAEVGVLDPKAHAPPEVPEGENAAAWLLSGAEALVLSEDDKTALAELLANDSKEDGLEAAVDRLLERNADALARLHRAGGLDRSSFGIDYSAGPGALRTDLLPLLQARRVLAADARRGLAAADRRRLLVNVRAHAALHRALQREPLFVYQLLATAVERGYHDLVQDVLLSDLADAELLEELESHLDSGQAARSHRAALAVEASWLRDWSPGRGAGFLWRLWSPFEIAAGIELYRRLAGALELRVAEIEPHVRPGGDSIPVIGVVADLLIPNLLDGVRKHRAAAAASALARTAIALRLHALEHGAYPKSLEGFPEASRPDPYAGGAVRYERRAEGSAELSLPEAEALWRDSSHASQSAPRFVWRLPPSESGSSPPPSRRP